MIDQAPHQPFPPMSGILKVDANLPGWGTENPEMGMPQLSEKVDRKAIRTEGPTQDLDSFSAETESHRAIELDSKSIRLPKPGFCLRAYV
jgi:hypothetical protein